MMSRSTEKLIFNKRVSMGDYLMDRQDILTADVTLFVNSVSNSRRSSFAAPPSVRKFSIWFYIFQFE
jgi:hypothetical protein